MGEDVAGDIAEKTGGAGADAGVGEGVGAKGPWEGMEEVAEGEDEVSGSASCRIYETSIFRYLGVLLGGLIPGFHNADLVYP